MSSTTSKVKEFAFTPEIEAFGVIKASVVNGYLSQRHKSGGAIWCEFDGKTLSRPKKMLENVISTNEDEVEFESNFDSRKFVIKFIDLLYKMQKRNSNIMLRVYEIIIEVTKVRANKKSLDYYEVVKMPAQKVNTCQNISIILRLSKT